jgi:flagellar basal-body rod modification protein FlgD
MQVTPVSPPTAPRVDSTPPAEIDSEFDANAATDAFGLSFESLLQIVLTQLTFQDPLKPLDNFEFVSQLAQFSQIQQSQSLNEKIDQLIAFQGTNQATALLGRSVDIPAGAAILTGRVESISFTNNGEPRLTIETEEGQTISNIDIGSIAQVRE